jgi:hypothetical protein
MAKKATKKKRAAKTKTNGREGDRVWCKETGQTVSEHRAQEAPSDQPMKKAASSGKHR